MNEFVPGITLVDLVHGVIALTLLEGLLIAAYHHSTGKGVALREVGINLLSGLCLMLALRAALLGAWWGWIAACLAAAGVAHALDVWRRWER